ncbi:uncharacterized protein BP5553_00736 [Venustampulla echinocandica]|uniref:Uncharacterized protein n=1 Tax=Venustampulla echinocandica TaxID=2656787 RepID=A0A370TZ01_9HELO|nr:uncharacterized protein BP5553_00736 [Venustampulla echinocandica]RDL40757.1 hypothetical protein BP5553_00736 [Venustampulla echinocandica]
MLASHIGATAISPMMGDDTMEISSDHGHHGADDEIDIDIDLTASYADDDYMLEDTGSTAGFGGDPITQHSPATHDDLMVDEYPEAYTMEDEDVEFDGDDQQMDADTNIVQEAMADAPAEPEESNMAEASTDSSRGPETNNMPHQMADTLHSTRDPETPIVQGNSTEVVEAVWHQQGTSETAVEVNYSKDGSEDTGSHDVDHSDVQEPAKLVSENSDPSPTPQDRTSPASITKVPSLSPGPASDHDAETANPHVPEQLDTANDHEPEEGAKTTNENEATNANSPITAPDVVVVYQSMEYSLFSKSEDDNPDSFFLSDLKVLESSLDVFFEDIRNVIHEDLADEDELCLSVEDLGLEIEEVRLPTNCMYLSQLTTMEQNSTLFREHTLGDIIGVYNKLLSNDDRQSSRPLYMSIGARPNFSKRLVVLTSGAAEGKGLSEMISFDDGSEGIDDLEAADHNVERYEETAETTSLEELDAGKGKTMEKTIPESEDMTVSTSRTSPLINDPEPLGREASLDLDRDNIGPGAHEESNQGPATSTLGRTNQRVPPDDYLDASAGHVEEEDLIDYSDEEYQEVTEPPADQKRTHNGTSTDFFSPCLKPNACFCSKCAYLLLAEYEEINEELRRRSVSPAAEESQLELSRNIAPLGAEKRQELHNGAEDEARSEDGAEEIFDDGTMQAGDEGLRADNIDGGSVHEKYQDEPLTHEDSENGEPAVEYGIAIAFNGDDAEEAVYDDESNHQDPEDEIEIYEEDHRQTPASSGLEPGDIAESSATLSVDEPRHEEYIDEYGNDEPKPTDEVHELEVVTNNVVDEEQDEIDYEDGEDEKEQSSTKPENPLPSMAGGGLKRPLSDLETGGAETSKEAKRTRS